MRLAPILAQLLVMFSAWALNPKAPPTDAKSLCSAFFNGVKDEALNPSADSPNFLSAVYERMEKELRWEKSPQAKAKFLELNQLMPLIENPLIYEAVAAELGARGLGGYKASRIALEGFHWITDPQIQLDLAESILRRVDREVPTTVDLKNLLQITKMAKKFGKSDSDFIEFHKKWQSLTRYERDGLRLLLLTKILAKNADFNTQVSSLFTVGKRFGRLFGTPKLWQPLKELPFLPEKEAKDLIHQRGDPNALAFMNELSGKDLNSFLSRSYLGLNHQQLELALQAKNLNPEIVDLLRMRVEYLKEYESIDKQLSEVLPDDALTAQTRKQFLSLAWNRDDLQKILVPRLTWMRELRAKFYEEQVVRNLGIPLPEHSAMDEAAFQSALATVKGAMNTPIVAGVVQTTEYGGKYPWTVRSNSLLNDPRPLYAMAANLDKMNANQFHTFASEVMVGCSQGLKAENINFGYESQYAGQIADIKNQQLRNRAAIVQFLSERSKNHVFVPAVVGYLRSAANTLGVEFGREMTPAEKELSAQLHAERLKALEASMTQLRGQIEGSLLLADTTLTPVSLDAVSVPAPLKGSPRLALPAPSPDPNSPR